MTELTKHLSEFQIFLLLTIVKVAVVLVITLTAVAYTVLLERKVIGRMQNRWGPSRVGPFGLLQPLADGIKLFLKEDLTPLLVERPLFLAAPLIAPGALPTPHAPQNLAVRSIRAPHAVQNLDSDVSSDVVIPMPPAGCYPPSQTAGTLQRAQHHGPLGADRGRLLGLQS